MSRRKKKNRNQQFSSAPPPASFPPVRPQPTSVTSNFDSAEDKIRGQEIMMQDDLQKAKQAQQLKKSLDDQEVDRRLQELRKQLGLRRKE